MTCLGKRTPLIRLSVYKTTLEPAAQVFWSFGRGMTCDKNDFSRARRLERTSIPVSEHVPDHQSRAGDQVLHMFSRRKPQRAVRGHSHVRIARRARTPVAPSVGGLERDEFTILADDL